MKLGIDADPIGRDGSGNEMYLRGLIGGLLEVAERSDSLILAGTRIDALQDLSFGRAKVVGLSTGILGDVLLGRTLRRAGADIVLAHYNAPFGFGGPIATVIHDVAFLRHPETYPRALRTRLEWSVRRSIGLSALVVTVSAFSRRELLTCYPSLDPSRVIITPNAPRRMPLAGPQEAEAIRVQYDLPEEFILAVGNLQPRKNLGRLVSATASLGIPLVVVGQALWKSSQVTGCFNVGKVRWLGRVSDSELAALYAACSVFAYPSLYEGYGLPVVEAMAAGAPVVTSNTSALPEVADDAALLVNPQSVPSISEGIGRFLHSKSLRDEYRLRGRARAASFSWTHSAEVLLTALRHLLLVGD